MIVLLTAFLASFLVTLGVIRWHRFHGHLFADEEFFGVQKFHRHSVARIGGVGVALGLTAAALVLWLDGRGIAGEFALLLAAGIPAFAGGLAEDVTKRVGVGARLVLTMGAACAHHGRGLCSPWARRRWGFGFWGRRSRGWTCRSSMSFFAMGRWPLP